MSDSTFLQDKAENFVMAALFCASEEGNVDGLQELVTMAQNIDLNTANRVSTTDNQTPLWESWANSWQIDKSLLEVNIHLSATFWN